MHYTDEQRDAIRHGEGPALILAVPGAGKTSVLLERVEHLVTRHDVSLKEILSMTFSKQQALDMAARSTQTSAIYSTIHAFCYHLIRAYDRKYKIKRQVIESSGFSKYTLIQRLYRQMYNNFLHDDELESFFTAYSYYKNTISPLSEVKTQVPAFKELVKAYEKHKQEGHFIDFDDMLTLADTLLNEPSILRAVQNKYRFVQIDEGQDTSLLQMRLIEKISASHDNLFIVADDDQSIYGFRGADPDALMSFPQRHENTKIYYLSENHRSPKEIVDAATCVIRKNKKRYDKNIFSQRSQKKAIQICPVRSLKDSFRLVARIIEEKEKNERVAVLYRNNVSAAALVHALDARNIDFHLVRSATQYLDFFMLQDLLDIIRFSENPEDLSIFQRIYYKLNSYISKTKVNLLSTYDESMPIMDRLLDDPALSSFYVDRFLTLKSLLSRTRRATGDEKIRLIAEEIGYREYVMTRKNLENAALSYDYMIESYQTVFAEARTYADCIDRCDRLRKALITHHKTVDSDVILSTVHGSKGLEYDKVIVLDLADGEFPLHLSTSVGPTDPEEERRLFYVAMTRAKKHLYLLVPTHRNTRPVDPSPFLKDWTT